MAWCRQEDDDEDEEEEEEEAGPEILCHHRIMWPGQIYTFWVLGLDGNDADDNDSDDSGMRKRRHRVFAKFCLNIYELV